MLPAAELRRLRRRRGIKQAHLADLMAVSQPTVSRWERGELVPTPAQARGLWRLLGATPGDGALARLVRDSSRPVHLICDRTHRLLAASPARTRDWRRPAADLQGRSLWRYASAEIAAAEAALEAAGWYAPASPAVHFATGANGGGVVPIAPGRVLWERLCLDDGTAVRLVTALDAGDPLPAHNLCVDGHAPPG